jgi:hypothetical protein
MIANDQEKHFLEKTKDLLNRSAENLDSRTRQRLEHIRRKALRAVEEKPSAFFPLLRWIIFGGFATATMAAVTLFFWLDLSSRDLPERHFEDLEMITSQERIDFHQDLDFYRWLATQRS